MFLEKPPGTIKEVCNLAPQSSSKISKIFSLTSKPHKNGVAAPRSIACVVMANK